MVMQFCPVCSNLLLLSPGDMNHFLKCQICPYTFEIRSKYSTEVELKHRKEADDLLGAKDAWDNVDKTKTRCPECAHDLAYFHQLQIRSADEPMTCFYKCCKCSARWQE